MKSCSNCSWWTPEDRYCRLFCTVTQSNYKSSGHIYDKQVEETWEKLRRHVMDIRLNWLKEKHFKGIKDFTLQVNGSNAHVFGDNGTGKTTQFDSFLWLLFGKNSEDKTTFKIKPQDAEGNDIHMLQTEVEAELSIDGKPMKLKKMSEEKWTKKRGSESTELTGNTISYWVNEVPVKESEYKFKICSIVDETVFRMITNPMFFNTKISWQDRRKIIIEICGDVTDEEVLNSDTKLAKLKLAIADKSIDDYKKIVSERLKDFEKSRDNIPPRIDELMLTISHDEPDYSEVEKSVEEYRNIIAGIESEMSSSTSIAADFRKKQNELYSLKGKLDAVKNRIDTEANKEKNNWFSEKLKIESRINQVESDIQGLRSRISNGDKKIKSDEALLQSLRKEWAELVEKKKEAIALEFVSPDVNSFTCPTCKQSLPTDDVDSKLIEMFSNFENEKKKTLEKIDTDRAKNKKDGEELAAEKQKAQAIYDGLISKIEDAEKQLKELEKQLVSVGKEITKPNVAISYSNDVEYDTLENEIKKLQAELELPIPDNTSMLLENKKDIQLKIDACNKILNNKNTRASTLSRIEELKAEEKKLSAQISELEGHKYLIDQFIVSKVSLIEGSINNRFKYVNFRLFDVQINGGVNPCCEALINTNGSFVPFSEANHAGKINAGLDIISTLCSYYGVTAPIFIDNRESVSKLVDSPSQIINLIKPPTWDELDKETRFRLAGVDGELVPTDVYLIESAKSGWNDRNSVLRVEVEA